MSGIIGKTQGVSNANNPPIKPKPKILNSVLLFSELDSETSVLQLFVEETTSWGSYPYNKIFGSCTNLEFELVFKSSLFELFIAPNSKRKSISVGGKQRVSSQVMNVKYPDTEVSMSLIITF